jgi:5-methylcytosine-specific restriction enzyme A
MSEFVETIADVVANIRTLDSYTRGNAAEHKFSRARIKNGKLFVALPTDQGYLFAPSKFVGYKNNDMRHAELLFERDGRETNVEVGRLLGDHLDSGDKEYRAIDDAFLAYCQALGIEPSKHHRKRRYWLAVPHPSIVFRYPEEVGSEKLLEGATNQILVNRYERSPEARAACIAHYGTKCSVCNFEFVKVYGELGADYIHVHHIVPLSRIGKEYTVDPIKDLRPVCPNCHSILHRGDKPMAVGDLRAVVRRHLKAR